MADVKYADGAVAVTPENRIGAGDLGEWNLVFTLEEETLPPGSAIRISMPQGFSPPQIDNPDAPGFVSASVSSGSSSITVSVDPFTAGEFDLHTGQGRTTGVTLYVERAPLKPQDPPERPTRHPSQDWPNSRCSSARTAGPIPSGSSL